MKTTPNILFDLYGTLVDIRTDEEQTELWDAMKEHYEKDGCSYSASELKESYRLFCRREEQKQKEKTGSEYPEIDLLNVFKDMHKREGDWNAEETALLFRKSSRLHLCAYPETIPALERLKNAGKGIYLLSNAQSSFTISEMKETGIYDFFDGIFISSDLGIRKPDPAFALQLLEKYSLAREDCMLVGNDFACDVRTASLAGIRAVYINTARLREEEISQQGNSYTFEVIQTLDELEV